jgi:hypothetical protein
MPQNNRETDSEPDWWKLGFARPRWGAVVNSPNSPLQAMLGTAAPIKLPVSEAGVSLGVRGAQAGMTPSPDWAAKELADTLVSLQHSRPSVQTLLQEASRLSRPDQLELIALLVQKVEAPTPTQTTRRPTSIKRPISRDREIRWLAENRNNYVGQWVVVEGDRLIASGPNSREVFQAAKQAGIEVPFLVQVEPEDQLPFGGW